MPVVNFWSEKLCPYRSGDFGTLSIFWSAMSDIEKKSKEERMEQALEESRYMLLLNKLLRLRCIYGEKWYVGLVI